MRPMCPSCTNLIQVSMMPIDALPDDLDVLRALVSCLSSERDAAIEECRRVREQNDRLHHLLRQLQRAQFGRRSERLDHEQMQLALEDIETTIAEQDAQEDKKDTAETPADAQRKKRCANRGSLPAHLPRIHVTLAPEIAACPWPQRRPRPRFDRRQRELQIGLTGWPASIGMGGRLPSESVAGLRRNQWPASVGILRVL